MQKQSTRHYISKLVKNSDTNPSLSSKAKLSPKPSKKLGVLAVAYTCFFLVTLWAAYHNQLPLDWLTARLPYYDKIGHVLLYCIPTYLGHRLCRQKHFRRLGLLIPTFPLCFALFTITEEIMQGFAPHRTLDAGDMVCSLLGIGVGYWLAQRSKQ